MSDAAWNTYFRSFADDLTARWARAEESYRTLKEVRQILGLPFYQKPSEPGGEGGWGPDLDQQAADLKSMAGLISTAFRDAADGKRKVQISKGFGDFTIERLPSDPYVIRISPQGAPFLTAPGNVSGTVGIAWGAVALAAAVVTAAQAYVVVKAIDALEEMAEQKTMQTLANRQAELVESGKATPQEAKALTDAVLKGTAALQKEKTQTALAKKASPEKWSKLVGTVGVVGVILLIGYGAVKMLPAPSRRRAST